MMMRNAGQARDTHHDEGEVRACKRLWASVVRTAADDIHSREDKLRVKSLAWIGSDDEELGSFLWCCDVLDLNACAVRRVVARGKTTTSFGKYSNLLKAFNEDREDEPTDQATDETL